jgi:hypothetical protein
MNTAPPTSARGCQLPLTLFRPVTE